MEPSYLTCHQTGELKDRIERLRGILQECALCPRRCGVNRLKGEKGVCRAGHDLMVSSVSPHFGEEPPLVGFYGSGTIFLTHCNLRCLFCQNDDISHGGAGSPMSPEELARAMIGLQRQGCHNINFVTPTHYAPQIVEALPEAIRLGLHIPLVWNCGGYESMEVLKLLDGIVDIYMPDLKFGDEEPGIKYCSVPDYPSIAFKAVKEMHRQVGDLQMDNQGIALRGLLIRHLVMPGDIAGTRRVARFIAEELSLHAYINIMDQYRPCHRASQFPEINRGITLQEYQSAVHTAKEMGLYRGF